MKTLNIAIIGFGRMGKIRAEATKTLGHNLVAIFDIEEPRKNEVLTLFPGVDYVNDLFDLPIDSIDVLFICSPPCFHNTHISFAISNDLPFLIEKPLSVDASGLTHLQQKINAKSLIHAVGYMNRYRPSIQHVKNQPFLGISSYWINKMYQVPWWSNVEESGGPLNEQATHLLDLNRFLMGEVDEVFATSSENDYHFETTISINLKFKNGTVGNILYSCDANSKNIGIDLFTPEEKITLSGWDFNLVNHAPSPSTQLTQQDIFNIESGCFFQAVIANNQDLILSDINDALHTQYLVDAVNLSIKTNAPVDISNYSVERTIELF